MSLYEALKTTDSESVVANWVSIYQENSQSAMLQIFQLLFDCCGFERILTLSNLEDKENYSKLLKSMVFEVPEDTDAPISSKYLVIKIGEFFLKLIFKSESFLFEESMIEDLFCILVALTRDKMPVFRIVGTLAALKCTTALLAIRKNISKSLPILRYQWTIEQSKDSSRLSQGRLESLINSISDMENKEGELEDMLLNYAVKTFLKGRILDTELDVQLLCITELSVWMQLDPETFMVDKYFVFYKLHLRNEQSELIRKECLKMLIILYEAGMYQEKLLLFSRGIKNDLVLLTKDVLPVAKLALKTLLMVLKVCGLQEFSKNFKVDEIFYLVFNTHQPLAKEAAAFLVAWMEEDCLTARRQFRSQANANAGASTSSTSPTTSSSDEPHPGAILLQVAQFLQESMKVDQVEILVERLLPHCPALRNWPVAVDLLLHDAHEVVEGVEDLLPEEEVCLIRVVAAAICAVCSGLGPGKHPPAFKKKSRKHTDVRQEVTALFLPKFSLILRRFSTEENAVACLLDIMEHFSLQVIKPNSQRFLNDIAKVCGFIFEVHCNNEILNGCCKFINYIDKELQYDSDQFVLSWQIMEMKYLGIVKESLQKVNCFEKQITPDSNQLLSLSNYLTKMLKLVQHRNLCVDDLWDHCMFYFHGACNDACVPFVTISDLLKICHLNLLGNLKKLIEVNNQDIETDKMDRLKNKCSQFLSILEKIMNFSNENIKNLAYHVTCDILQTFADDVRSPSTRIVSITINNTTLDALQQYVEKHVFKAVRQEQGGDDEVRKEILEAYTKLFSFRKLNLYQVSWLRQYFGKRFKQYQNILKMVKSAVSKKKKRPSDELLMPL